MVSVTAYTFVYNYPSTAEFLTEEERTYIQARLKEDNDSTQDESFTWSAVLDAFKDPKVWLYCLGFHTMSLPLYTYSLFIVSRRTRQTDRRTKVRQQSKLTNPHSRP